MIFLFCCLVSDYDSLHHLDIGILLIDHKSAVLSSPPYFSPSSIKIITDRDNVIENIWSCQKLCAPYLDIHMHYISTTPSLRGASFSSSNRYFLLDHSELKALQKKFTNTEKTAYNLKKSQALSNILWEAMTGFFLNHVSSRQGEHLSKKAIHTHKIHKVASTIYLSCTSFIYLYLRSNTYNPVCLVIKAIT